MALIECEDCGAKVSSRAASCPNCGGPMEFTSHGETSIQTTGKLIKLQSVSAKLGIIVFGSWWLIASIVQGEAILPILGIVASFIVLAFARFQKWWHHE